ncbi:DciA family protein [Streptomyces katrae]|uniref:DciA family protein n=1 Tax=Streptomyces katrae TaxID=68223 RepID=UPI0005606A87|nr:DciA family protein [Streptomyces katrae]
MTEAINLPQAPASGVDLARQALAAARAAARQRGDRPSGSRKAHRARTLRQPDGREPIGFAALLANLVTDRAWELPSAAGSLVDDWPTIATDLTGHVALTGYDPATGELAVRPVSSPYATAVRLRTRQLIDAANQVLGSATAVRTIRILPPGTAPAAPPLAPEASGTPPTAGPVPDEPYEAPAGYREAIAAHRQARVTRTVNPAYQAAAEGQIRNALREPEHLFADGLAEFARLREQADRECARSSSYALAVARARAEKAGLTSLPVATGPRRLDLSA